MMPAVAPIAAARPQPIASMRPTRMPQSRAETGFCAAARMAKPVEVKRKKTNKQHEHDQRYRDDAEIARRDQRLNSGRSGKGLGKS